MLTFGRRFTFWALRHITDRFQIAQGPLAFPLFLTLSVAALTNAFGLHPLLGAFVVGLLLRGAPRVQPPLIQSVQTMTFSFFGPIFFVLAGMCVNVLNLGVVAALGTLLLLFIVATGVKVLAGLLGARLGGLRRGEALLVGIGLNVKGGSDVVVALVGTEIGLLSSMVYTLYAVVAILTVLLSSPLLNIVDRKVTPSVQEIERHEREAIQQAAAVRWIEHVLVPTGPPLVTSLTTDIVRNLALAKRVLGQVCDVTRVVIDEHAVGSAGEQGPEPLPGTASLQYRGGMKDVVTWFLEAGGRYDLVVLGAHPTRSPAILASDSLASSLIRKRSSDILIVLGAASRLSWPSHRRILVPVNGLAHAITASDLAAYLAQQYEAEIVLLHVVPPHSEQAPGERAAPKAGELDRGMARRLAERLSHIGIRASSRVHVGYDPGEAIVRHLGQERYGLVVLGGVDRGAAQPYLGATIPTVLRHAAVVSARVPLDSLSRPGMNPAGSA